MSTAREDDSTEGNRAGETESLVREHFEAINERDMERVADLHAYDVVVRSPVGDCQGFDEVRASWKAQLDAIPDLEDTIDTLVVGEDAVAVRYTTTGTLEEPLFGIEATGSRIELTSMAIVRSEDGQIVEWLNHPNVGSLLAQLDVVDLPSV